LVSLGTPVSGLAMTLMYVQTSEETKNQFANTYDATI
jgi:hypothetical protein